MLKITKVLENKVQFDNGAIGVLNADTLVSVDFKGKTIKAQRLLKKYVVALEEYNKGQQQTIEEVQEKNQSQQPTLPPQGKGTISVPSLDELIGRKKINIPQQPIVKEKKNGVIPVQNEIIIDDSIRVESDGVYDGDDFKQEKEKEKFDFGGEKFDLYNPLQPPKNQSYFARFIENFPCQFNVDPSVNNYRYDIVINDNCRAKKIAMHTPMGVVEEKFNVFTMNVCSGNKEIDTQIMNNMACLMTMYLKPYGLSFDIEKRRYSDDELEVDMFIRNSKFKSMGVPVGDLRKLVHIVYFLAKKEVKGQYRDYVLSCFQKQQQKNA